MNRFSHYIRTVPSRTAAFTLVLRICISVLVTSFLFTALPVWGESDIYGAVVRLHVLAASDRDEDQAIKLKVRDAVLKDAEQLLGSCATADEAAQIAAEHLDQFTATAQQALKENGSTDTCRVTLTKEYYPTREYENFTFPAGQYTSLRVLIGPAQGHNWWCVLFPPLCLGAATKTTVGTDYDKKTGEIMHQAGLTQRQIALVTDTQNTKTVVRFKLLELFSSLFRD